MTDSEYHLNRFGNHQAERQLRCFYLPNKDTPQGLVDEHLHWALFDVQSLSFGVRFVLVAASADAWTIGNGAVCGGLLTLIRELAPDVGFPTTLSPQPLLPSRQSIWVLQAPDRTYHLVTYEPKQHRVSWLPVFSMDPMKLPGSIGALRLLFPVNADEGIEALEVNFWSKHKGQNDQS